MSKYTKIEHRKVENRPKVQNNLIGPISEILETFTNIRLSINSSIIIIFLSHADKMEKAVK